MRNTPSKPIRTGELYPRQIAFCAAFLLPLGKFLEAPALLSKYAKGDILLPAILHFLVQSLLLLGILYAASKSEKSILERIQNRLGKWSAVLYILFALYYLFAAVLPLLDLEKFVYAAFFDTAPTTFSFGVFFILLAFICTKGLKSLGRCADLCLFLFLLPFLALIVMAFFETDLTKLLPFFGTEIEGVAQAFTRTTPHFADAVLLLPLLATRRYKEGDGVKIMSGYWAGAGMTLLFFAVFFGIFSSIAPREHYAFLKIAQYFPALDVVGRIDLIFIYLLSAVLLFYTALPLLYATELTAWTFHTERKVRFSAPIALAAFLFVLFMNKRYDAFYALISGKLAPIFWLIAYLLPLFCLFLPEKSKRKERINA
nr:GerAB/ArcD/ProY family transporter [Clostridia bacterium]